MNLWMPTVFAAVTLLCLLIARHVYFKPWDRDIERRQAELDARKRALAAKEQGK